MALLLVPCAMDLLQVAARGAQSCSQVQESPAGIFPGQLVQLQKCLEVGSGEKKSAQHDA